MTTTLLLLIVKFIKISECTIAVEIACTILSIYMRSMISVSFTTYRTNLFSHIAASCDNRN